MIKAEAPKDPHLRELDVHGTKIECFYYIDEKEGRITYDVNVDSPEYLYVLDVER